MMRIFTAVRHLATNAGSLARSFGVKGQQLKLWLLDYEEVKGHTYFLGCVTLGLWFRLLASLRVQGSCQGQGSAKFRPRMPVKARSRVLKPGRRKLKTQAPTSNFPDQPPPPPSLRPQEPLYCNEISFEAYALKQSPRTLLSKPEAF